MTSSQNVAANRRLLIKVPEVTLYFWVIKVLCTTVGETAADFLNVSLGLGLSGTSVVTGILLAVVLVLQFRADRYIPIRYWLAVTLVSVFGTLVTDNLTDSVGLPLEASTVIFAVLLALTFLGWYRAEQTLSIHSITSPRREAFYWLAILFTFALGTATGDLMAEVLGLGYLVTLALVACVVAVTAIAWRLGLHSVLAFWIIYILTRPLGASIGDLLSQPPDLGGLGLGATVTSVIFLLGIAGIVTYLSITKADVIQHDPEAATDEPAERHGGLHTIVVVALVLVLGGGGYALRTSSLQAAAAEPAAATPVASPSAPGAVQAANAVPASPLGDLSQFRGITQNTLDLLNSGDQAGATSRVDDLETAWDNAQARLKAKNKATWTEIDGKIDTVLTELRASRPDTVNEKAALTDLLSSLT
jgi:uncharacterized membrane-anchored protein